MALYSRTGDKLLNTESCHIDMVMLIRNMQNLHCKCVAGAGKYVEVTLIGLSWCLQKSIIITIMWQYYLMQQRTVDVIKVS